MFENLRPINKNAISDMRGLIDPSNLAQFNLYEGGYAIFKVLSIPYYLQLLCKKNKQYRTMIETYVNVLEQEFKGLDGLNNIEAETDEFTNNLTTIQMINKITYNAHSTFTLNYTEKAGAVLTRTNEFILTGIKDPKTGFKHYHGIIKDGTIDLDKVGFQSECFTFLYMITDNTGYRLERSYLIVGAQPTNAPLANLYESEKGNYEFKQVSMEYTGYALTGDAIDEKAKTYLEYLTGKKVDGSDTKGYYTKDVADENKASETFRYDSSDYDGYVAITDENGPLGFTSGEGIKSKENNKIPAYEAPKNKT